MNDQTTAPLPTEASGIDETRPANEGGPPVTPPAADVRKAVLLAADPNFQATAMLGIYGLAFDCCLTAAHSPQICVAVQPTGRISTVDFLDGFRVERQQPPVRLAAARRAVKGFGTTGAVLPLANKELGKQFDGAGLILFFEEGAEAINAVATIIANQEVRGTAVVMAGDYAAAKKWNAEQGGR